MKKSIKKVKISPGCVSCGTCVAVCPEVFQVSGISKVKDGVDLQKHEPCIKEAAEACPVDAIELIWDEKEE